MATEQAAKTGRAGPGRPPSTTREEVGRIALDLFRRDGFEQTTMADIAAATGVGRRTLFRYYASKNDIVWGDFDAVLDRLRRDLSSGPVGESVTAALRRAVVSSNSYPADDLEELRIRMGLITTVPALQGHSMLRYRAWREVVAEFVADREGFEPHDLRPEVTGHVALGAAMAAFSAWVRNPGSDHEALLDQAFAELSFDRGS